MKIERSAKSYQYILAIYIGGIVLSYFLFMPAGWIFFAVVASMGFSYTAICYIADSLDLGYFRAGVVMEGNRKARPMTEKEQLYYAQKKRPDLNVIIEPRFPKERVFVGWFISGLCFVGPWYFSQWFPLALGPNPALYLLIVGFLTVFGIMLNSNWAQWNGEPVPFFKHDKVQPAEVQTQAPQAAPAARIQPKTVPFTIRLGTADDFFEDRGAAAAMQAGTLLELPWKDARAHIGVIGAVNARKTTGVMSPILNQLLNPYNGEEAAGMLILDPKGDYDYTVGLIAYSHGAYVRPIGMGPDPKVSIFTTD